jgi:outer membrane lipopolysaccharide assembly protein LptE/RlpB
MRRLTVLLLFVLTVTLSGCGTELKNAVGNNATSIKQLTGASAALVPHCQSGNTTACNTIGTNLAAIDAAADVMIKRAK